VLTVRRLVKHSASGVEIVSGRQVGAVQAVERVDLQVYPGETLAWSGESAAESRLWPGCWGVGLEKPTGGAITVLGREWWGHAGPKLKRCAADVQMIFQDRTPRWIRG